MAQPPRVPLPIVVFSLPTNEHPQARDDGDPARDADTMAVS
jgi:hypothetical protein